MFFYCKLNKSMHRKICEQFQLLIITEDIMILIKKLSLNLFNYKHKTVSLYWKKSELYNKNNNKSAVKLNEKSAQSKWDQFIKCFNCDKTDYIVKNCYLIKREKLFIDTANKKDLWSSHKIYDFTQENESINKKTKKKSVKRDSFKKRIL